MSTLTSRTAIAAKLFSKNIIIVCYLLTPGLALVSYNKKLLAYSLALSSPITIICFGISRLIILDYGIIFLLFSIFLIYLLYFSAYFIYAIKNSFKYKSPNRKTLLIVATAYFSVIASLYLYKDEILGFDIYYIASTSMKPTLNVGDIAIVDTWVKPKDMRRDQIILFKDSQYTKTYIKRVKAVSGDFINGKLVGNDQFYVVGDNFHNSIDSRQYGTIQSNQLVGRYAYTINLHIVKYFQ